MKSETSLVNLNDEYHFYPPVTEINIIHSMFNIASNANGTPQSVYLWAQNAFPGNTKQQRGFEILAAKFILTFCQEAEERVNISHH